MAISTQPNTENLEFLRQRVASFGLFSGGSCLFFWVFRMSQGDDWQAVDSLTHLAASVVLLAAWPPLQSHKLTSRAIRTIEAVALLTSCALLTAMGMTLEIVPGRPDLIMVLALTFVTCSRAVYVPSSGSRTALLNCAVGAALLGGIYVSFSASPLTRLRQLFPNETFTSSDVALDTVIGAAAWWVLSSGLAFATSKVIYGLRKDVRASRNLGQYQLHHKIGEGGMGIVYEAHHAMLRRSTAIKLLPPEHAGQAAVDRFEREVKLTARLRHPNTVTVYDYGRTPDGIFYYAMELLDGATLSQIVSASGAQPPGRIGNILKRAAGALSEAHELGLIHRDIKPDNIMLCRQGGLHDVTKVLDFGLVKDISPAEAAAPTSPNLTQTNAITGTPLYMAPEAIKDPSSVGVGSDLYALGAVGYFLLTGEHVFDGTSVIEICSRHLHETPQPPSERTGSPVPPDLERLILDCLAKEPGDRPASAQVFLERLLACRLPDWSQADAQKWWHVHSPDTSLRKPSQEASSQTIMVDLARRSPSLRFRQ